MNRYFLIPVIVLLLFASNRSGYTSGTTPLGGDSTFQNNYQANHDLYIDQAVKIRGSARDFTNDADRLSGTEDDSILPASIRRVSATVNAGILVGILTVVILVSGSITYMKNRKMNV